MATEQEKVLQQREEEIAKLKADLGSYTKLRDELVELKNKNEEKEMAIKSNEQSNRSPNGPEFKFDN